jgi:hypothetical protein
MDSWKIVLVIVIACIVAIPLYFYFNAAAPKIANGCSSDDNCVLSLCDCQCHMKGQTPEEQKGIFCGINCLSEKGVSGCICSENICKAK